MELSRYLDCLHADGDLLARTAGRSLAATVPCCPGWTVRDVVLHVAAVYQHKVATIRRKDRRPETGEWPTEPPSGVAPIPWFEESLSLLLTEFAENPPDTKCWTWYEPEQDVAFWCRRMAHETAVHRVDVEQAFGESAPVPTDLAIDGIDELLERMLAYDWFNEAVDGHGESVLIDAGDHQWLMRLAEREIGFERAPVAGSEAGAGVTVRGEPEKLYLWLWGRLPISHLTVAGDGKLARKLREHYVTAATQ
ncbi:MAG: maleylpyruvate isomerase family mycothiol-dependent enzyme [Actinomycetes bacterium]|jgi:uncharacterized protein (TIGR03083 family)|nr:maleylpyruvate isomerase family mycothiol-dependent enzyme [Actinomycetes bacterium]